MIPILTSSWPDFSALSYTVATAVAVLVAFWLAGTLTARIIRRVAASADNDRRDILLMLASVARTALTIFGVLTALSTLHVNINALIAGLGLTGFALGFAFRDALSNLLAGMLILFYQPFQRGDQILVAGFEGTVKRIDMRYTTIEVTDGRALIPNSTLLNKPVHVIEKS